MRRADCFVPPRRVNSLYGEARRDTLFFTSCWFLYRKAWLAAGLNLVLPLLLALASVASVTSAEGALLMICFTLLITYLVPLLAAHWIYFHKCRGLVDSTIPGESRKRYLERLAQKGGTSWAPFAVAGLVVSLVLAAIVALDPLTVLLLVFHLLTSFLTLSS